MKIDDLKRQARDHERDEEWSRALGLYRRAIEALEEADEPDISLYNRVADLHVRLGQMDEAVERYDEAVRLYLESGLENNAVAVCRKLVRNAPERPDTYLKLGQIRAEQGFVVDAREHYLTYAQMQESAGNADEVFRALEELADRFPEDPEIRRFLGEQYLVADRTEEGLKRLLHAWQLLEADDRGEEAEAVAARIRELDPAAEFPDPHLPPVETEVEDPTPPEVTAADAPGAMDLAFDETDFDETGFGEEGPTTADVDSMSIDGFESTGLGFPEADAAPLETESSGEPPIPEAADDDMSFDDPFEVADEEEDEDDHEDQEADPLPLLDDPVDTWEPEPTPDPIEDLRDRVEAAVRSGSGDELIVALRDLAEGLDSVGDEARAASVRARLQELEGLSGADGIRPEASDDSGFMPPAATRGADGPATPSTPATDEEALEEEEALPAPWAPADSSAEASGEPPVADPPPSGDYVDLGSLVLDESGHGSTRWTVDAEEPSGDEDADFSRMLASFKEKVADNLSRDDARSQYDLGAAYREMGLWDEAISQFQQALRADPRHLGSFEMMGQCFLEKGEPRIAVRVLERATELSWEVEDDLVGIYYYLGQAHEAAGGSDQAREYYEKVFSLDINFMDVTDRLRALR